MSSASTAHPTQREVRRRLLELMLRDRSRVRRRLDAVRKSRDDTARAKAQERLRTELEEAERRVAARRAGVPTISYPAQLPVSQRREDLLAAIAEHQVVVVAGETGSGKTTQLPKFCLELGRGVLGTIGHTQPRRLAARTVAERVASELDVELGAAIGWKVRFTDHASDQTLVKVMTDGILLAEIQQDRMLRQYDTLIIDEAHERSLNIDFILGYLKQLLPRRPDLKVIITSATIDPERFAAHFAVDDEPAPIVEVSGRTYPVQVRYRPVTDPDDPTSDPDRDRTQAVCDAVDELCAEGPGDILCFLSGEREIRDTADALGKHLERRTTAGPPIEVLPLYARLAAAEQHRVFQRHSRRRVVLATNVAETSLTVPGIKYVIDPGTARISRYSQRTKVQRLPIEPISQASANQRKGRCGRTSDGICIRLYSEEDFQQRPEFTDPEILRTNLASVILAMAAAELGRIESFPFIDPPDRRNVAAGVQLLEELGALESAGKSKDRQLTTIGKQLAQLPVDPRLARMVLEADRNGCVREVLIIAAALSIQDPRERPAEAQQSADEYHRRFVDQTSDFLAYLNLWNYLREQQRELSSSQFRKRCKREYLNYLRVREWQDVEGQLRQIAKGIGVEVKSASRGTADADRIHQSLLSGLLAHLGMRDPERRDYRGARGTRFAIFPGSGLFKKQPQWVMAAELVETSRLWGRIAAAIQPEWAEELAPDLVKRTYSEPHWSKRQGAVLAYERVTLYGVPIVAQRRVNYGRVDSELARELFIRHALVYGEWETRHQFFYDNQAELSRVEDLEARSRRRDIKVDDETIFAFYDQRIPAHVVSARHFDAWWKKARRKNPDLLRLSQEQLVNDAAEDLELANYPTQWRSDSVEVDLSYTFDPGEAHDGVTADVPLAVLNQLPDNGLDWQVPGLREELVTALIRSLPKSLRRNFVPAPNYARAFLEHANPGAEPLLDAMERVLGRMADVTLRREDWDFSRVPDHLRVTFRILDEDGTPVREGSDLAALKRELSVDTDAALSNVAAEIEQRGLREWSIGTLPHVYEGSSGGQVLKGYPALVDEGDSVAVCVLSSAEEQARAMWAGTRKLLLLGVPDPAAYAQRHLTAEEKLGLAANPHGGAKPLLTDCVTAAADALIERHGGPAWDASGFAALREAVRADLPETTLETVQTVSKVLSVSASVDRRLRGTTSLALLPQLTDIRGQLNGLVHEGFVAETGLARLPHLVRYLRGIDKRLDKLPDNPRRDQVNLAHVEQVQAAYDERVAALPPGHTPSPALWDVRWLIEEYRVSLFAQELGTAVPVSDKRIRRALAEAG